MDTLQAGFQTAPVKLPLTPYQKAVKAREAIANLVQQQMQAISSSRVRSDPSQKRSVVHAQASSLPQRVSCTINPSFTQICSSAAFRSVQARLRVTP